MPERRVVLKSDKDSIIANLARDLFYADRAALEAFEQGDETDDPAFREAWSALMAAIEAEND